MGPVLLYGKDVLFLIGAYYFTAAFMLQKYDAYSYC